MSCKYYSTVSNMKDVSDTWWVIPPISIGVLRLSKNTRGHLVFPDRFFLICTKCNVGSTTRGTQHPEKRKKVKHRVRLMVSFSGGDN